MRSNVKAAPRHHGLEFWCGALWSAPLAILIWALCLYFILR